MTFCLETEVALTASLSDNTPLDTVNPNGHFHNSSYSPLLLSATGLSVFKNKVSLVSNAGMFLGFEIIFWILTGWYYP